VVSEDRSLIAIHDDVPPLADDHLVALAEAAERRVEAINRIKQAALKATNAHDWVDQQGRPYLQVSGAEKIARLFGISWRIDEPILEREEDGHFAFTYKGYFRMGVVEIEVIGSRSSRDPFFSKARGEDIPPSAIDRQNVKKAALTNCIGNGITRLLGIRNLTWDDLAEAGIKRENVASIEYRGQEMSEEAKARRDEIWSMLLEMSGGDEARARDYLEKATEFTGRDGRIVKGKRDIAKLSEKAIGPTYGKVKQAYERWQRQQRRGEEPQDEPAPGQVGLPA